MADFIPAGDLEFDAFLSNMAATVAGTPADYNLSAGYLASLAAANTNWAAAFAPFQTARNAFHAATLAKDGARAGAESAVRSINNFIQGAGVVTDAAKEAAGFPVRDTTRTPAPVATSGVLIVSALPQAALQQVVNFRNQDTPDVRAKPPGQQYAEIRAQVGGSVPLNGDTMETKGLDGATPYLATFSPGDENKVVYYCARWINTRGLPGPWGPVFASTVPGAGGGS